MSMKLNLKLLATRFFQAEDVPSVSEDGVNRYLLEHILCPNLKGNGLYLGDINFGAFDAEDVPVLEDYHDSLIEASRALSQFAGTVDRVPPVPRETRAFC